MFLIRKPIRHNIARHILCFRGISVFTLLWGLLSCAHTDRAHAPEAARQPVALSANPSTIDYSRPPFTPDEFIEKIVQLMQIRSGYVTPPDFEKVFNVRFPRVNNKTEEGSGAGLEADKDWYFTVGLASFSEKYKAIPGQRGGLQSSLIMTWLSDRFGDPNVGECVSADKLKNALVESGWKHTDRSSIFGPLSDYFVKNGNGLEVRLEPIFQTKFICVISLQAYGFP